MSAPRLCLHNYEPTLRRETFAGRKFHEVKSSQNFKNKLLQLVTLSDKI